MLRIIAVLVMLALAGCQRLSLEDGIIFPQGSPDGTDYPMVVKLRAGQSVALPRGEAVLTFERVVADSRCPIGVVCVWAGDGAVELVIQSPNSAATADTLHTTLEPKAVTANTLVVQLKQLDPYPVHGTEIDPSAYVATLEIDRAPR